jgi:O-antigen ligase
MAPPELSASQQRAVSVIVIAGFSYAIALFNPYVTGILNTSLYVGCFAWLYLAATRTQVLTALARLRIVRWMLAAAAVLLVSALGSPDRWYSLTAYRREWLEVVIAAVTFGSVFATPRRQSQLLHALGIAAATMVALELVQYGREVIAEGGFAKDIARHRWYADSLIFLIPAVLGLAWLTAGRMRWAWASLLGVQLLLLAATSSRGAWLGAALSIVLAWPLLGMRRALIALAVALGAAVAITAAVLPPTLTDGALERGLSTTLRDQGTWGPSYEMIAERPLLGFGYGNERFHEEFNRRAPERPWWSIRESIGPHSMYLQVLFAAGVVGLAPFVVWIAILFGVLWHCGRTPQIDPRSRALCYAAAGALTAWYLGRGFVEVVRWAPLGVIAAIAIGIALQDAKSSRALPGGPDNA